MDGRSSSAATSGGRGARLRILDAATRLFYEQGIVATGMKELTDAAHVSTRTFYQHFASKDELVVEYLTRWDDEHMLANERSLDRLELTPAERLLGLFAPPSKNSPMRGCPFHDAAVEISAAGSPARSVVVAHKRAFLAKIVETVRETGVSDATPLASQLAILYEGAAAWLTSTGDRTSFATAGRAAIVLLDASFSR